MRRQFGIIRLREDELRCVGGVHMDDAFFGIGEHLRFDIHSIDHSGLDDGFDEAAGEVA